MPDHSVAEGSDIQIPTEDGITWQDIRLMAGEGKLTKKTVLQAIAVIRKQRREQGVNEKMLPKSTFVGSDKNKLGSAGQWKNTGPSKNRPARAGDLVGGAAQESAGSGVIASKKQAKDPRYSMSLTKDVRPGQIAKNLKAFSLEEDVETAMATAISKLIESQLK
jgi:hypothetical protein